MILTDKGLKNWPKINSLIQHENLRQIEKWGVQTHTGFEWLTYTAPEEVIKEAIQTATLALRIVDKIVEMYLDLEKGEV